MRSPMFYGLLATPALALAAHYNEVKVAVKLIDPDSVHLEVDADHDDLLNTVMMFPDNKDTALMRVYQTRIEAYLVSRLPLKVDGKGLPLKVIRWKPGGKGRADGFDSTSLYSARQVITLGAALPANAKKLTLGLNLWAEFQRSTVGEIAWFWNGALLDRRWSPMEKTLVYPLERDSLLAAEERAKKKPPPPRTIPEALRDDMD